MFRLWSTIEFSEVLQHNNDVSAKLSPLGDKYAFAQQFLLKVRDLTHQLLHTFVCTSTIESFEWSPSSELIACSMSKGTTIQVWSISNPTWNWKLDEGPLSIIHFLWNPDSESLLVAYEFHIKVKIWSLVSTQTFTIEDVKPIDNYVSFKNEYIAIALNQESKDYIGVYTKTGVPLKIFPVETKKLSGIEFSPHDLVIAGFEKYSEGFKILFHSIDGQLLSKYEKPSLFGITTLSWHERKNYIALGNCSGEVTVLNGPGFKEHASYQHLDTVTEENIIVYKIEEAGIEQEPLVMKDTSCDFHINKVVKERPLAIPSMTTSDKKKSKHTDSGITIIEYSLNGKFVASICGDNVIYVYNVQEHRVCSIIIHHQKITSVSWHKLKPILAICSGCSTLDMWTPSSCISCISPFEDDFSISVIQWSRLENVLLLNSRDKFATVCLP